MRLFFFTTYPFGARPLLCMLLSAHRDRATVSAETALIKNRGSGTLLLQIQPPALHPSLFHRGSGLDV